MMTEARRTYHRLVLVLMPTLLAGATAMGCAKSSTDEGARIALLAAAADPVCAGAPAPAPVEAPSRAGTTGFSPAALKQKLAGTAPITETHVAAAGEVIENRVFSNPDGTCLFLDRVSDVVVRRNHFMNCKQSIEVRTEPAEAAVNISIHDNLIEEVYAGIVLVNVGEKGSPLSNARNVSIHNNRIENILPPPDPKYRHGGAVGFQFIRGCDLSVSSNSIVNAAKKSEPSDLINLFMSAGKPGDPIRIEYNLLHGGRINDGHHTETQGGIVMGDGCVLERDETTGRSACEHIPGIFSEYQRARGNVLIETGKFGLGIAGGRHLVVEDNIIYGTPIKHEAHWGLAVYDTRNHSCFVYGPDDPGCVPYDPGRPTCANLTIRHNRVHWYESKCIRGVDITPEGTCGPLDDQWIFDAQHRIWPNTNDPQAISYCGPIKGIDHHDGSGPGDLNAFHDLTIDPDDHQP